MRRFVLMKAAISTALLFLYCAASPLNVKAGEARASVPVVSNGEESGKSDRSGTGMITGGEILSLNRCVEIALKKNPSIVAALNNVDVNRSRVGEARAGYYPQLSGRASYNRSDSGIPVSGVTGTFSGGSVSSEQYAGSLSLTQNILDFGKTSSSVDAAKYRVASSRSDLATIENSTVLRVKQAYYNVLQAKRNRTVAADVIKQFELHLEQAKGFYEVGTRARIDVIKAEVDLSNAKLRLINAENSLKIAWVTLNNAMGVPDAPDYSIEDNLLFSPYMITPAEATARAFENRPDLKSAVAQKQAAEENISFARAGYYPVLSGLANYTRYGDDISSDRLSDGWQVGLVLTVPLFTGFLTSHQVAEAKSTLYVLKANEESLRQQILLEVRQAFLNLQAAEASIFTAELAVRQARENMDLANGRYDAGVGSPVEVSDAFATYVAAEANFTSALANYKIAQASIENAMGVR